MKVSFPLIRGEEPGIGAVVPIREMDSSYFANDTGRYKTIFQAILRLHSEDVIWVYQQNASGTYERYTYTVEASFETYAENVGVLSPGYGKHLTLITCTPIGTTLQRRVVRATLTGVEK